MIDLSARLRSIKPSPTLMLSEKAATLKSSGRDIISLTVGEPDFPTPSFIGNAGIRAIECGQTKYTAVGGTAALKNAIQHESFKTYGITYAPNQIVAGTGGKQILFNALLATLNPGDEVIIPAPYWVSYVDMTLIAEGRPIIVPCGANDDFKLTGQSLESAITPKTKWVILNSPSNPTGQVYTHTELAELADVLRRFPHVGIISDDIYEKIIFNGPGFSSILHVDPTLQNRTLIVNGFSKAYSMTGWRLGYGMGPATLIGAMTDLQSHSTSNACSITQAAGVAALTGPQDFLDEWRMSFRERHDLAFSALAAIPGIDVKPALGAFYLYPCCNDLMGHITPGGDVLACDDDFAAYLLDAAGVAVVPGSAFGLSPYFRLSCAVSMDVLSTALNRIRDAVMALTPAP